ncbi:hypothetical protein [Marinicellulosiphila megalodicopiae]|uniref:hypothetical protein n=1 Tax=Marinicellulosiphila megalodicopiae TaxID=2724896 RepID=UPI003BB06D74
MILKLSGNSSKQIVWLISLFILNLMVSQFSHAQIPAEIYKMPENITFVKKVGHWQKGTLNGGYQLIVEGQGKLKGSHHLYIRWVCHCMESQLSILSITQMNTDEAYVMTEPRFEYKKQTGLINFYRKNIQTDLWQQVQIQLTDIGEYQFVMRTVEHPQEPILAVQ